MENLSSLGPDVAPNGILPQTNLLSVQVESGASVQIDPQGNTSFAPSTNWILSGNGISQPFSLIDQRPSATMPATTFSMGSSELDDNAGIGVEQVEPTTVLPALTASQLTIQNEIENYDAILLGNTGGSGDSLTKLGSRRLIIEGPGTYNGGVTIADGVLLDQNNTGLGAGNTLTGGNTPEVTVDNGAALELGNVIANGSLTGSNSILTGSEGGGLTGGLGIYGDDLVLNGSGDPTFGDAALTVLGGAAPTGATVQTLTITGSTTGGYFLSFGGQTTAEISATASAAQLQAALDALTTIGGADGSVSVFQSGMFQTNAGNDNVYTITFGGSLLDTTTQIKATDTFTPGAGIATVPVPTIGNFSLAFNGKTTASLTAPATAFQGKRNSRIF